MGFGAGDTNLYAYVFNNPANLTDPFGLTASNEQGSLSAGIAGRITGSVSNTGRQVACSLMTVTNILAAANQGLAIVEVSSNLVDGCGGKAIAKRTHSVVRNRTRGLNFEKVLAEIFRKDGYIVEKKRFQTKRKAGSLGWRYIDMIVKDKDGKIVAAIEAKLGSATRSAAQLAKDKKLVDMKAFPKIIEVRGVPF